MKFVNTFTLKRRPFEGSKVNGDGEDEDEGETVPNQVKNEAINSFLNVFFDSETPASAWHIGLIDNAGFINESPADTAAVHPGWVEFINYQEPTRQVWTPNTSSTQITSGTIASFTIGSVPLGTKLRGLFVSDNVTKGVNTGLLFSTGLFTPNTDISPGEIIDVTYSVRLIN